MEGHILTIISTLIGLLGSFAPGLLNFFTTRSNNNYQIELIKLQMQAAAQGTQLQIDLANTKADVELQQALYSYDANLDAGWFINALRGSVRPVITYTLFLIWLNIELIGLFYGIHQGKNIMEMIPILWDQNTNAIWVTIVAFWFGSRMMEKYSIFPPINQPKTTVAKRDKL